MENFLSFSNPQPYLDLVNSFHQRHLIHKREVLVVPNTWMSILDPQNVVSGHFFDEILESCLWSISEGDLNEV